VIAFLVILDVVNTLLISMKMRLKREMITQ